jgi:hypothetical protein
MNCKDIITSMHDPCDPQSVFNISSQIFLIGFFITLAYISVCYGIYQLLGLISDSKLKKILMQVFAIINLFVPIIAIFRIVNFDAKVYDFWYIPAGFGLLLFVIASSVHIHNFYKSKKS